MVHSMFIIPPWLKWLLKLTEKWLLKLNINKCKVVSYGRFIECDANYYLNTAESVSTLEHIMKTIKDLGVTFDSELKFDQHIIEKVNKAYSVLGVIPVSYTHLTLP